MKTTAMTTRAVSACLLFVFLLSIPTVVSGSLSGPKFRRYQFNYQTTIPAPPAGTRQVDIWVPLPLEDPGVQEVSGLQVTAPDGYQITTEPVYGNRMIHVSLGEQQAAAEISWTAEITRYLDQGQGLQPTQARFLEPNELIPLDGKARELAVALGAADDSKDITQRAKLIYDDVLLGMVYDKSVPGYGNGDFMRSVEVCKGNCTDFHARFTGVGRASGIPVRFTMGIPLKEGQNSYNSYHCWAHWHDGSRWKPVDISEADKVVATDPERAEWFFGNVCQNRIALTVGRDITLSPAQSADRLNYFVFPYAEADGRAMKLDRSMWDFHWKDL